MQIVAPRNAGDDAGEAGTVQISNGLLEIYFLGPRQVERPHVPQVLPRKSANAGKRRLQIVGKTFDDRFAPSFVAVLSDDNLSDVPIQPDQLSVDRKRNTSLPQDRMRAFTSSRKAA